MWAQSQEVGSSAPLVSVFAPASEGDGISLEQAATAASHNGIEMRMFELHYEADAKATDYAFSSQLGTGEIPRAAIGRFIMTRQIIPRLSRVRRNPHLFRPGRSTA
jgi:hypothetical protein